MQGSENSYFLYFLIFLFANIVLFLFYRFYEAKAREQAVQDRLDTLITSSKSGTANNATKGLFEKKTKSESLLDRKLNAILSKRSSTDQPLQLFLYRCGISMSATKIFLILMISYIIVFLLFNYILKLDVYKSFLISIGGISFGFYTLLSRLEAKRKKLFLYSLSQAVDIILRGIRSGSSIEKTFAIVARESSSPLKEEFEEILKEIEFGVAYDRVLVTSANKVDINEYYFLVTALIIQRQSGGSLSDVLENIIYVLDRTSEMKTKVRIVSAEGRLSGIVLAALPLLVGLFMYKFNPEHLMFFYYDPLGNKLAFSILFLFFCGYLSIRKIITIKA